MSGDVERAAEYGVTFAEALFEEFRSRPEMRGPKFCWAEIHESIGKLAAASLHSIERFDDTANEMLRSVCGAAASVRTKELVAQYGLRTPEQS
jgi:hypothetical protein